MAYAFSHSSSFPFAPKILTLLQIFAREKGGASLALLNTYAAKIQSYCDTGTCLSSEEYLKWKWREG
jgi:hypothetical protein